MPKRPMRADDLLRFTYVGDPQISRDGERILFAKKTINDKNKVITHLCTVDLHGAVTQWTQGEDSASHGRWSLDGAQIAFISKRSEPSPQIYLIPTSGGEARKLTTLPEGSIGGFKWSPDGTKIAFTFRDQLSTQTSAAKKEREEKGLSEPPIEIDDVLYRLDGDGYFANQRYKLYVAEVSSGEHRLLCEAAPDGAYAFDWSPNSKELAVIHTASKRPMADPPNDQIWRVSLDGQAWKLEGLPRGNKSSPAWSPDGQTIAYSGDVDELDPWGTRNAKIYAVSADGGEPRDLTGHLDYDFGVGTLSDTRDAGYGASLEWAPDSTGVYCPVGWHGESQLGFVPIGGGVALKTEGNHVIGIGNVSGDGVRIAATFCTPTLLAEVAVIEPELSTGKLVPRILTSLNQKVNDEVKFSEPEEFWIDSTDDTKLHGWVLKPIDYLAPRRYPAVLEIHGGPHAQYGWAFFHEFQMLAAEGYVVVYTNPRGSKGYGEEHCAAIRGDWGNKDWEDIQTASRWMQSQPYISPGQMAVMGGSYGGYMTNWVIGHTDEFKCAVSDRCVSNMVSMAGNSDFPFNKDGYFKGVAWGSLEEIESLWKQSPISFFSNVKTPTLVIHSEGDLRCNIEQGEQVFTALQQQGIDSRFVRYPKSTSHGMSRGGPPDLRLHRLKEISGWLQKYLK